ncbi:MAG TPA: alpha/beta fold hydrolase [Acidimicrobiales bacterium]|jgi:pimeloyl-ACP methyl ester carboxylesterase|nr:alpha/beta fold hydrolase [Acidimicrobiales bacterium]
MPLTTFAGGRLFGVRHGHDRPWVLALHGWQRSHGDFASVLESLDAVALDLPGFGAAPEPPAGWSPADYANWVAPVLDELAERPVVLGHSFGGRVAVHLAATHGARVGAVVLTGVPLVHAPGTRRRRPPIPFRVGRTLRRAHLVSDSAMEALRQRYGSADYRNARGVMRQVLVKAVGEDGGYGELLAAYPGPIELVWGADDTAAPVAGAETALGFCRQGRLCVVTGVDHFTPRHAVAELRAALERHRPESSPAK